MAGLNIMKIYSSKFSIILCNYLYTLEFNGSLGFLIILFLLFCFICTILCFVFFKGFKTLKKENENLTIENINHQQIITKLEYDNRCLMDDITSIKDNLDSIKEVSGIKLQTLKDKVNTLYEENYYLKHKTYTVDDSHFLKIKMAKREIADLKNRLNHLKSNNIKYRKTIADLNSKIEDIEYVNDSKIHLEAETLATLINNNNNNDE